MYIVIYESKLFLQKIKNYRLYVYLRLIHWCVKANKQTKEHLKNCGMEYLQNKQNGFRNRQNVKEIILFTPTRFLSD